MLARWYLLLGQFSVTFEYRPGAQHANADGMSRQCGQCQRPDCPVSASDSQVADRRTWRPVLYVWHVNLRVRVGHPWDMLQWVIAGIM